VVTDDDPAILLDWKIEFLPQFVASANGLPALPVVQQPPWITTVAGSMTPHSLINDILNLLETVAGGRHGAVLLAPNNLAQYSRIIFLISRIESNAFMQRVMQQLPPGPGSFLATVYQLQDKRVVNAEPCILPSESGVRKLFH
jgi:hypothetical protein